MWSHLKDVWVAAAFSDVLMRGKWTFQSWNAVKWGYVKRRHAAIERGKISSPDNVTSCLQNRNILDIPLKCHARLLMLSRAVSSFRIRMMFGRVLSSENKPPLRLCICNHPCISQILASTKPPFLEMLSLCLWQHPSKDGECLLGGSSEHSDTHDSLFSITDILQFKKQSSIEKEQAHILI